MKQYIFDVDGTLTPSRGRMDYEFKSWFNTFCLTNNVYLVTGSDRDKTYEQIGETFNIVKRVYNCSGSEVWERNECIYRSPWKPEQELLDTLNKVLNENHYAGKTGNHIEVRTGLVNFSIVGRNATVDQRKIYVEWDNNVNNRKYIAEELSCQYSDYEFKIAGETGIDITPLGSTKAQILKDFDDNDEIYFYGDKCKPGGNDYEIYNAVTNGYEVDNWEHTWNLLKKL